jgi:hypothetical protein
MRDACVALATEIGGRGTQAEDRHEVGSTWHDAGTLFMGDDPFGSVTDTSGHFHHVGNVACVDQALFPAPSLRPRHDDEDGAGQAAGHRQPHRQRLVQSDQRLLLLQWYDWQHRAVVDTHSIAFIL